MVGAAQRSRRLGVMLATVVFVLTVAVAPAHAQIDPAACTLCAGGEFFPVTPQRVFDTRDGTGGRLGPVPLGQGSESRWLIEQGVGCCLDQGKRALQLMHQELNVEVAKKIARTGCRGRKFISQIVSVVFR